MDPVSWATLIRTGRRMTLFCRVHLSFRKYQEECSRKAPGRARTRGVEGNLGDVCPSCLWLFQRGEVSTDPKEKVTASSLLPGKL